MKKLFLLLPVLVLVACAGGPASQITADRNTALDEAARRNLDAYVAEHGGKSVLQNPNEARRIVQCGKDICLE